MSVDVDYDWRADPGPDGPPMPGEDVTLWLARRWLGQYRADLWGQRNEIRRELGVDPVALLVPAEAPSEVHALTAFLGVPVRVTTQVLVPTFTADPKFAPVR